MGRGRLNRLESGLRRGLQWAGGMLDYALRRRDLPQTDVVTLLPRIEGVIERHLRPEAGRLVAPDLVELRYDYETWSGMGEARRARLEDDLARSLFEYTVNRRYRLAAPLRVSIGYDAFTRGVEIRCSFAGAATLVQPVRRAAPCLVTLIEQGTGIRHQAPLTPGAEPVGIGRNIANGLVIRDATISNFHAALVWRADGQIELADRGGANGTAVNGAPLATAGRVTVVDGDVIRLGRVECRISIAAPAGTGSGPSSGAVEER